jgi:hypothetical protein
MMPISQNRFMKGIGFGGESEQTIKANVYWWCNLVHKVAAADEHSPTPRDTVAELLEKTTGHRPWDEAEPNQPGEVNEPPGGQP